MPMPKGYKVSPERPTRCYCQGCGDEIYEGEEVYVINGDIMHADWECLVRYIDPEIKTIKEGEEWLKKIQMP